MPVTMLPAKIETVREITLLRSIEITTTLVQALTDDQRTSLISIINTEWAKVRFKVGHVVPNRADLMVSKIEQRRQIRHTVRIMLGLDPVSDEEIQMAELDGSYGSVIGGTGGGGSGGGAGSIGEFGVFQTSNRNGGGELS